MALPESHAPKYSFPWNGELELDDPSPGQTTTVITGRRVCNNVLVKRMPAAAVDGAAIDFNIALSAAIENEQRLQSGMIHIVKTLTCHFDRPSDDLKHYYVVLEHCDYNLRHAVDRTVVFMNSLRALSIPSRTLSQEETVDKLVLSEENAPMLMWQTRRSIARQLLSGVAFLHRTGLGPLRRIYHGNLKPSNILLKNGIVKISEVNCYSHTDPAKSDREPPPLRHSVSLRDLGSLLRTSEDEASRRVFAALQQAEFAPLLTPSYTAALAAAEALTSVSAGAATDSSIASSPTTASPLLDSPPVGLPSTLSAAGRVHLLELLGHSPPDLSSHADAPQSTSARRLSQKILYPIAMTTVVSSSHSRPADTLYQLSSYGDMFATGCLIYFSLTLGKHPFGTLSLSPKDIGSAVLSIARNMTPNARTLASDLHIASQEAHEVQKSLIGALSSGSVLLPTQTSTSKAPIPSSAIGVRDIKREMMPPRGSGAESFLAPTVSGRPVPVSELRASLDHEEAADLVASLLDSNPRSRLTPQEALAHPFFWSVSQKFLLVTLVSESTVVQQDHASGAHAAFAADIQSRFLARLPPGSTSWSPFFPLPPGTGTDGWSSPLWPHRDPCSYESVYAGPFSMYSLVRWCRNLYIHGPEHVRTGLFSSAAQLEAYILGAFPWLIVELWHVDQLHGGSFTAQTLADAGGVGGSADSDYNLQGKTIAEALAASASVAATPVSVNASENSGPIATSPSRPAPDPTLWGPALPVLSHALPSTTGSGRHHRPSRASITGDQAPGSPVAPGSPPLPSFRVAGPGPAYVLHQPGAADARTDHRSH